VTDFTWPGFLKTVQDILLPNTAKNSILKTNQGHPLPKKVPPVVSGQTCKKILIQA
jgi:hypothetical protein